MIRCKILALITVVSIASVSPAAQAAANPERGKRIFGACAACHSLQPGRNMTGPSLAGLWNRKAGSLQSFARYSPALKSSGIVWNEQTLDAWLADPQRVVPGNSMTFPGIKNAQQRADLIAFLKQASEPGKAPSQSAQQGGQMGGMAGMMGGQGVPNLKKLDDEDRVQEITYCRDTYSVTTADGKMRKFWERNLRFKTDSSEDGPAKGKPALTAAGMAGDRADVIFADPGEISQTIKPKC